MNVYELPAGKITSIIKALTGKNYEVYAPVEQNSKYIFSRIEKDIQWQNYGITYYAPKFLFLPAYERLLKFRRSNFESEPILPETKLAIFGVRPCDMISINYLDKIFSKAPQDYNYLKRRKNSFIIQMDCIKDCSSHQFCSDMDSYWCETGYDLALTPKGEGYLVRTGSEAGVALIQSLELADATQQNFAELKDNIAEHFKAAKKFDSKTLANAIEKSYDSPVWKEEADLCFSCGTCNMVCPCCYCFNVSDEVSLNFDDGERCREWDSCMLRSFATVAGGENFREGKHQRLRHRVHRKGYYNIEQYGRPACVGCGRCSQGCLAQINIHKIFSRLIEESN